MDTSPEREVGGVKLSVSGKDGYSVGVGIQVTLRDSGPFLHSGLKGQVEKAYNVLLLGGLTCYGYLLFVFKIKLR